MNNIQKYGTFFDSKLEKTQLYGLFIVYSICEYIIDKSNEVSDNVLYQVSHDVSHDPMQYGFVEYDVD
jgi:hypothetical protein